MTIIGSFVVIMAVAVCTVICFKLFKDRNYFPEEGDVREHEKKHHYEHRRQSRGGECLIFEELAYDGSKTGKRFDIEVSEDSRVIGRNDLGGKDNSISRTHMNIYKTRDDIIITPLKLECPVYLADSRLNIVSKENGPFSLSNDVTIIKLGSSWFKVTKPAGSSRFNDGRTEIHDEYESRCGRKSHAAYGTRIFER